MPSPQNGVAKMVARFAKHRRGDAPTKNFQSCDIIYEGQGPGAPLAAVYRRRKTKRSAWTVAVRPSATISWLSPAELRNYFGDLATAAEAVVWPEPEVEAR